MSRYVFDIETDGLLNQCTRMWILVARDIDTGKTHKWLEGDMGWLPILDNATLLIGHNILGFDLFALEKLFKWKPRRDCNIHDTLILSQLLDYKRFENRGHSLEVWGDYLEMPKIQHDDWSQYSENMDIRCHQDVNINCVVYEHVMKEFKELVEKAPLVRTYVKAEHAVARWCSRASMEGWPFDLENAKNLMTQLETEMNKAYEALSSKLGYKVVAVDLKKGIIETKRPKWTKAGFYDVHTAKWFDIDPCSGFEGEERPILGEYTRIEIKPLDLDSVTDVKIFLFRHGWVPTDWNYKKGEDGRRTKTKSSPKITEDSLEFLGGDGKLYADFLTARARHSILKTWIDNTDEAGNLHGDCMPIGTPSMRARHSIIVNVPAVDSPWGEEMRSLFTCKSGWKLIGCDSSGNQARGLAHYLGNQKFIDTLLHGDIHQYNADVLTRVLDEMGISYTVKRAQAKRILYAFLFGASGSKLWSYIFGTLDETNGPRLKNGFLKAVPGFKALLEKLGNIYGKTSQYGDGYIPSLAGNRIYVDSFHKLLVYLLQSAEKITCASALMLCMERLEAENIPYIPCIFMHDEIDFQVPEQYAQRAAEIGKQCFVDGPKLFGVNIMDGEAKVGNTWYDIH